MVDTGRVSSSYVMAEGWFRKFKAKSRTGIEVLLCPLDFEARIKGYRKDKQTPQIATLEAVTSLPAASSGHAIRRSAAIPDSRRRPAADPAGGATESRSRPPPRCAQAGRRGKSECLRQTTADGHWVG